ncbi:MAG: xanthine dehydrogenase small subunit [Sneathiella sp.]|jgi:xanthine dehydrogenase small subunit|uniref:xanthine dehydrogenase small subunit n=1 Tax=Sneathiella sp. TaxID=1964365 RepID=UPI000C4289BB|nr:xanthine dehydrogenase small subunit [Sneathiella sp.]MAL80529.1 xanthine dehydrogenase small subunit [Sneathiella sp.]
MTSYRQRIKYIHHGRIVELGAVDPTMTLLNYLRYEKALTGTKEGCAEGDCGACTVVLGEAGEDGIRYQAVNACIQFLPTIDGKELITVEDLKDEDGALHPVQQAMVEANATQCGFCTPGFVMSIFADMHNGATTDRQHIDDVLAGNLCRCTGYGPIVEAARNIAGAGTKDHFHEREGETLSLLKRLAAEDTLHFTWQGRHYYAPDTVEELADILDRHPDATLVAGATDVGLWITKQHRTLPVVVYLGKVTALQKITQTAEGLLIGAGVTYSAAWPTLSDFHPDLGELVRRIASTQIRNCGTIGGNIANGSPIGDMPPALIALNSRLRVRSKAGVREIPLEEFFIDYGKQDLREGEFVETVFIPVPAVGAHFATYKISKRFDQDISALCGAMSLYLEKSIVADIRICFGGMAGTPKRATTVETALIGKSWDTATLDIALNRMGEDYAPLSDMRASREYRLLAAKNLLRKFLIETTDSGTATRIVGVKGIAHA